VSQAVLPVKDATNTSRSIDAWSLGGGTGSLRQAAVLGDPSVDAAVAAVKNGQVDPSNYGLVTRRAAVALPAHRVASGTSGDFLTVKNSSGVVHLVSVSNYAAYPIFLKFFDKATTPVPGTDTVVWTVGVQAGVDRDVDASARRVLHGRDLLRDRQGHRRRERHERGGQRLCRRRLPRVAMKRIALFLALVVATLAQRPVVAAGPYYVCAIATCPGASNANAGTFGSPWLTISYGVAHISAGETLYIRGGVYTGSTNVIDSVTGTVPNGTDLSTGAVTIAGYAGETAIIKPPSGRNAIKLTTGSPHHIIIQDLELDGSNQIDSLSESEMLYVANNSPPSPIPAPEDSRRDVRRRAVLGGAVEAASYDYTFAANLELLDSEIYAVGKATGDSGHGGAGINNGYCLYSFVDNVTIRGNNCHDLPGSHGWNVYADHIVIERNISAHNGRVRAIASNSGFSICSSAYGDPPGPALPCTDILVRNNVAWDNTGDGITIYTGADGTLVYNNTAYGNSGAGIALQFYASAPTVKNNIVYGNTVAGSCNGIKDYGGTGSPVCANNLATTPSFTNATLGIFTITCPGSAACDAGVTLASVTNDILGNTRPSGSAYDIGAYEANASGTAVSITTTTLPNGTLTVGYSATIAVTGGTGTYASCTVSAGSLPTGLSASIVSNACQISGTPSAVNSFSFTIQACDNAGSPSCDTQAYTVSIVAVCTPGSSGNWSLIDCPGASSSNGTADAVSVAVNSAGRGLRRVRGRV
jgi:parallel beta-helix repeat protein